MTQHHPGPCFWEINHLLSNPFLKIFSFRTARCPKLHDEWTFRNQRQRERGGTKAAREGGQERKRGSQWEREALGGEETMYLHAGQFRTQNRTRSVCQTPGYWLFLVSHLFIFCNMGLGSWTQRHDAWKIRRLIWEWNSLGETLNDCPSYYLLNTKCFKKERPYFYH